MQKILAFLKRRKKILLVLLGLFLLYLFLRPAPNKEAAYITAQVKKGNVEVSILATGIVKPSRLVAVGARTTGRVIALNVKPGSVVEKGDLLAQIDSTTQENALKSREAALSGLEARLKEQQTQYALANKKVERTKTLISSNTVSRVNLQDAIAQADIQQAQIAALKAQLIQAKVDIETAKTDLGYTRVTAPISGTVLASLVQEGQNINAVQSVPTMVILGDLSHMTIVAQVSEADIGRTHIGQDVYFTVLGQSDKRYQAKLENIEPAPESIRNDISISGVPNTPGAIYYNATFTVPNPDNALRTYMTSEVHILVGNAENVLTVPSTALFNLKGDQAQVYVLENNKRVLRSVTVGLDNKVVAQIKSGLKEGEIVIAGTAQPGSKDIEFHGPPPRR